MAEKYPNFSPFANCVNNPIILVDPDGNSPSLFDQDGLEEAIKEGVTSVAEYATQAYNKISDFVQRHPSSIDHANSIINRMANEVENRTDMNPETMDWVELGSIWLFELGGDNYSHINFGADAATTQDLMSQEGVSQAREKAMNQIASGEIEGVNHQWTYGKKEFKDGFSEKNMATSFLGSYNSNIDIVDNDDGSYTLNYTVSNTTGWESGTRLRKDNDCNGQHDAIIPDKA